MQGIGRYTTVRLSKWSEVYAWIGIGIHRLTEVDQYPEQFSLWFSKPFTCLVTICNQINYKDFNLLSYSKIDSELE